MFKERDKRRGESSGGAAAAPHTRVSRQCRVPASVYVTSGGRLGYCAVGPLLPRHGSTHRSPSVSVVRRHLPTYTLTGIKYVHWNFKPPRTLMYVCSRYVSVLKWVHFVTVKSKWYKLKEHWTSRKKKIIIYEVVTKK